MTTSTTTRAPRFTAATLQDPTSTRFVDSRYIALVPAVPTRMTAGAVKTYQKAATEAVVTILRAAGVRCGPDFHPLIHRGVEVRVIKGSPGRPPFVSVTISNAHAVAPSGYFEPVVFVERVALRIQIARVLHMTNPNAVHFAEMTLDGIVSFPLFDVEGVD